MGFEWEIKGTFGSGTNDIFRQGLEFPRLNGRRNRDIRELMQEYDIVGDMWLSRRMGKTSRIKAVKQIVWFRNVKQNGNKQIQTKKMVRERHGNKNSKMAGGVADFMCIKFHLLAEEVDDAHWNVKIRDLMFKDWTDWLKSKENRKYYLQDKKSHKL